MMHLTRGIDLVLDAKGRLRCEPAQAAALKVRPLTLWVTLAGGVDRNSGLMVNVSDISKAFRKALARDVRPGSTWDLLCWARDVLKNHFGDFQVVRIKADLSDKVEMSLKNGSKPMVHITTKYELAASHRLYNAAWDDDRNRDMFGKCAHPAGHGHNYTLEVTVAGEPQADTGFVTAIEAVNDLVQRQIVERFDHKNLNTDCPDFRDLIPTVENMARVFWDLLVGRFGPAQLTRIAVWETPHACAEYFGPAAGPLRYGEFV